MARVSRLKVVITAVASLLAPGAFVNEHAADAAAADRALAEEFRRQGAPLDPVLSALSAGRLVRQVALAPGRIDLPAVPIGFALRGSELLGLDVTKTLVGQQELDAFLARLGEHGQAANSTGYTVYALPSIEEVDQATADRGGMTGEAETDGPMASALIVPAGTVVEFVGAVFKDGELHAKTVVSAAAQPHPAQQSQRFSPLAAPSDSAQFVRAGGIGCLHRKQNNTAWYDPCQEYWRHENDGDAGKDYYASQLWGTGKSKSIWSLRGLEVFARRTPNSADQQWVDWDPGSDADVKCRPESIEVSYAGASVGITKQHCEMWDISKHEDVRFSNWWRGSAWRSERETAMAALTKTDAHRVPHQTFDFDFYAR